MKNELANVGLLLLVKYMFSDIFQRFLNFCHIYVLCWL